MGVFIGQSTENSRPTAGEICQGRVPAGFGCHIWQHAFQETAATALLRRHRQTRGRANPRQNQRQRIAARYLIGKQKGEGSVVRNSRKHKRASGKTVSLV